MTRPTPASVRSTSWCGSAWCRWPCWPATCGATSRPGARSRRWSDDSPGARTASSPTRRGWATGPRSSGLLAFVWLELASPDPGDIGAVRLWVAVYVVVDDHRRHRLRPAVARPGRPVRRVLAVISHLSPFVRDRRLDVHNPLRTLPQIPVHPGLVAAARDAARLDGLRQLLRVVVLAVEVGVGARADPDDGGVLRRGGRAVPAGDPRHRRRHARASGPRCPAGWPTRWCRSWWATSSPTT